MRYLHTRFLVINFSACVRFYRDVLGFQLVWGDETGGYASFSQRSDREVVLALFGRQVMADTIGTGGLPLNPPGQDRSMLIVQVDDVDAEIERIRGLGVQIAGSPTTFSDWGYRGAYLRDPDGNLIELSSELPPDQWSDDLREADERFKKT